MRFLDLDMKKKHEHIFLSFRFNSMTRLRHFVIKSSQTTQLFTTKVFCKQSSCHHRITKSFFVANLVRFAFSYSAQSHD